MDLKNGIAIRFRQGQVRVKKKKTYLGAFLAFKGKKEEEARASIGEGKKEKKKEEEVPETRRRQKVSPPPFLFLFLPFCLFLRMNEKKISTFPKTN